MTRRAVAGLAAVALVVPGCGSGHSSVTQAAAQPGACTAGELALALGPEVSPMTGEHADLYALRNRSGGACTLRGYPSVRLLDAAGKPLPLRAARGRGTYVSHAPPRLVLLQPHGRAWFLVAKYRCDRGDARPAEQLELRLRGTLQAPSHLALCRGGRGDPGNELQLSPFAASASAAGPAPG